MQMRIQNLRYEVTIGIHPHEKVREQLITMDVTYNYEFSGEDDIRATVDYFEVQEVLRDHLENKEWHLLETVAQSCAKKLMASFDLDEVKIWARKRPIPNADHVEAYHELKRD